MSSAETGSLKHILLYQHKAFNYSYGRSRVSSKAVFSVKPILRMIPLLIGKKKVIKNLATNQMSDGLEVCFKKP